MIITPLNYTDRGNPLDSFITTLWVTLRLNVQKLVSFGLEPEFSSRYFGDNFEDNVETIIRGSTPQARLVLQNQSFAAEDFLSIPEVSDSWPGIRPIIYIRIYNDLTSSNSPINIYTG